MHPWLKVTWGMEHVERGVELIFNFLFRSDDECVLLPLLPLGIGVTNRIGINSLSIFED